MLIICLVGESASGKSTIERILCDQHEYTKIVSYTTRAPREGEQNGVDYWFVSDDCFNSMMNKEEFAEHAEYNGWKYGIAKKDCGKSNVVVVTPHGLRMLKKLFDDIISVYIDVPRRDRLIKILQRGDDVDESIRRNLSDIGMFDGIKDEVDFVVCNDEYKINPEYIAFDIDRRAKALLKERIMDDIRRGLRAEMRLLDEFNDYDFETCSEDYE